MSEDSQRDMAKVQWSAGIDHVSGALAKPGKGQHSCKKTLLGTHRTAPTESTDCNRVYIRKNEKRKSSPSARELAARVRFTEVRAMVKARKEDLTKITADQAAFAAQKDSPEGKKTMNAWYWKVCGEAWDEDNQ